MEIRNNEDTIDSRDVTERIEELTDELEQLQDAIDECHDDQTEELKAATEALRNWREVNEDELSALKKLALQGGQYAEDWYHGVTLISDSYFEQYSRELAEELYGHEVKNSEWPFNCIDWGEAAERLQSDYTALDFDGETYWVR